jgi:hypothetical protein
MCCLPKQFWSNNEQWLIGYGEMTYERAKPSGEITLFTMLKSATGPIAAKVAGINVRADKVYKRMEVSMSIARRVKERYFFEMGLVSMLRSMI